MCEFCEDLENIREAYSNNNSVIKHIQTIAIVDYAYRGGTRKGSYTKYSDRYKLNYCPMCGRDLKRGEENG